MSAREPLPVIACTLDESGQAQRAQEWRELTAGALGVEREPGVVRATFPAVLDARVRALAAAESDCCSFFEFGFETDDELVTLSVRAHADAQPILDRLF